MTGTDLEHRLTEVRLHHVDDPIGVVAGGGVEVLERGLELGVGLFEARTLRLWDGATRPQRRVPRHAVHRSHTVTPRDLLAFGVGAAVVGDADLVHPPAGACDLRGDLRLEAEAVLRDLDALDDVAAE